MIKLYEYQKRYLEHVKRNWIYDCDTGTGKTILGLEHYKRYGDGKLLIVAPASKLNEGGWDRTIKEHYPDIEYETCSYNMLPKKFLLYKGYFIIFDECHRLKNSTGKWGKAGYQLTQIASGFILLSATVIPNGWEDAINYFKIFGLTRNKTQFLHDEAYLDNSRGWIEIKGWRNESKLKTMYNSISRRLNKADCNDLPALTFVDVHFKPSTAYKKIKKDRIYKEVVYDTSMKYRHGLRLYSSLEDKVDYVKEFIENTSDNIIIFYNYDEELELLKEACKDKTTYICNGHTKLYPKKEDWDKVTNTVTLANYKSGAEGVEFTYANLILYFSPTDSYTEFYQSYGRAYRNGQTKKVTCYNFITENSIEVDIYKALENKQDFNWKLWESQNQ